MDAIFKEEQDHLKQTYKKLQHIESEVKNQLDADLAEALEDKENLFDEMTRDFSSDIQLETLAELEAMNRIIESYNLSADINTEKLRRVQLLLLSPYFAKIRLKFAHNNEEKDIYIGAAGMTDEKRRHFIVDWRSPVAEVYYNQSNGKTSYEANGRTIEVDLKLRRQFDISRNKLKAYFDTTIAIEDPLLLASLSKRHSTKLTAITTTIQREQNQVIRHKDVPALLVHGIAGSGKTSVLLQRIAYLFYTERENLSPDDVFLITPNPVFSHYIDNVLPDMGETNPHILTWNKLMEELGLSGRGITKDTSLEDFHKIDAGLVSFELEPHDVCDIRVDKERVITANAVRSSLNKYKQLPLGPHRLTLVMEDLKEKLLQRINRLAKDEDEQDKLLDLSEKDQISIFGQVVLPLGDDEIVERTREWLEYRYRDVEKAIEDGRWLRIDRIGMRLLNQETLDATTWLYLKLALIGGGQRHARYIMIDEVQDYTLPQLAVLARYFPHGHFLLLGDENQAVRSGTATFEEIRKLFTKTHGRVEECSLMISYRSSPEITKLFCKLLPKNEQIQADSVQRPGRKPRIIECWSDKEYEQALIELVVEAAQKNSLSALIAPNQTRVKQLSRLFKESEIKGVTIVTQDGSLPKSGVALLEVKLAKGLEFDSVIIPDVQEGAFPDQPLRRHRLYTAISRATENLTLVANGKLTKLLR